MHWFCLIVLPLSKGKLLCCLSPNFLLLCCPSPNHSSNCAIQLMCLSFSLVHLEGHARARCISRATPVRPRGCIRPPRLWGSPHAALTSSIPGVAARLHRTNPKRGPLPPAAARLRRDERRDCGATTASCHSCSVPTTTRCFATAATAAHWPSAAPWPSFATAAPGPSSGEHLARLFCSLR